MNDEKEQPDADKPEEPDEPAEAAESGEPEQGEDDETPDEQSGNAGTLDEIRHDAERSIETFKRLNDSARPWAQAAAFHQDYLENLRKIINPLASNQLSNLSQFPGIFAAINGMSETLKGPAVKGLRGASAAISAMATQPYLAEQFRVGSASTSMLKTLLSLQQERHEVGKYLGRTDLPGFATSTYEFLATTEDLKYSSNRRVWHYTSGWVLMQVLSNHLFWASSPQHLNDASEVTHGIGIIRDAFSRAVEARRQEGSIKQPEAEEIGEVMVSEVLDKQYIETVIKEIYYISASTDDDSLTLWRNYANGDGFAIGIDARVKLSADGYVLDPDAEEAESREDVPPINGWYRVHYTDQKKRMLADKFAESAIMDIQKTSHAHRRELVSELRKQTLILASTMKHRAFKDEKEVRWMTTNWMPVDEVVDVVHYEHARNSIVPVLHIKASSDVLKVLPLSGVRCSPVAPGGIDRTIKGLLRQKGYKRASENVRKSQQPFKG